MRGWLPLLLRTGLAAYGSGDHQASIAEPPTRPPTGRRFASVPVLSRFSQTAAPDGSGLVISRGDGTLKRVTYTAP